MTNVDKLIKMMKDSEEVSKLLPPTTAVNGYSEIGVLPGTPEEKYKYYVDVNDAIHPRGRVVCIPVPHDMRPKIVCLNLNDVDTLKLLLSGAFLERAIKYDSVIRTNKTLKVKFASFHKGEQNMSRVVVINSPYFKEAEELVINFDPKVVVFNEKPSASFNKFTREKMLHLEEILADSFDNFARPISEFEEPIPLVYHYEVVNHVNAGHYMRVWVDGNIYNAYNIISERYGPEQVPDKLFLFNAEGVIDFA